MKFRSCLILILLFLPCAFPLVAQFVGKPFIINYDKRVYGGDNQNWSVAVGDNGITYFGNDKGLLEFDGSNWSLHAMPENGIVRSVTMGDDGNLYVGSYQEFGYWNRDSTGQLVYTSLSRMLLPPGSLHNDEIWRILAHNGKIYFQSFSNIFIYDGTGISVLNPGSSMVLLMKASGRLFIHLVGKGLFEIVEDAFRLVAGSDVFARDEIKVILPYEGNRFLVGVSGKGMFIYDGLSLAAWDKPVNKLIMASELNNGIAGNNHLIIGTIGNGLFILDDHGNLQAHLDSRNFLQNNTILSVAFDAAGNIWAGLDRGIDLISLHSGMDFYVDPSGTMGSVYAAVLDGMDLLVGTNQGLYRYSFLAGEGFVRPVAVSGLAGQVWDLKNIDGEILCGHTGGTYRIEGDRAVRISDVHGGFEIRRMQGRSSEHLLQSTYSTFAVYSVFDRRWLLDHPVQGFNEPAISFETDHLGNIWCAHAIRGIFRIRLKPDLRSVESTVTYASDKGLPGDRQVYVSKVENRIVFPSDSGLFTWDDLNDTIIPFGQLAGKLGDFSRARQIMPSGEHNYWFIKGHDVALFRIAGPNADQLYRYDFSMQGLYLNSRFPKIIMLKEGLHLICLDNGFALFDETGMRTIEQPAPVQIRSAHLDARGDGERLLPIVAADKPLRIPYNFRSLTIGFSAGTGYRHPLYRQRLIGLDKDWGPWTDQPSIAFTRLPPGDYTLEVISMNINGLPGQPARYPFSVSPPWYRSIPALILYASILFAFIIFFRVLFLKRLRLHKALLEEAEAENHRQAMLRAEQELIRVKNEKLEAEVNFKNIQLADYTMSVIRRNEQLIRIRDEFVKLPVDKSSGFTKTFQEKILRLFDKQLSSDEDWKTFETHFDQAHQDFINRLKTEYPFLTQSDLKLCAYLRLNISSKEIAHLLNISLRGVEVRRYRLRKRLNLNTEDNLYDFLLKF